MSMQPGWDEEELFTTVGELLSLLQGIDHNVKVRLVDSMGVSFTPTQFKFDKPYNEIVIEMESE